MLALVAHNRDTTWNLTNSVDISCSRAWYDTSRLVRHFQMVLPRLFNVAITFRGAYFNRKTLRSVIGLAFFVRLPWNWDFEGVFFPIQISSLVTGNEKIRSFSLRKICPSNSNFHARIRKAPFFCGFVLVSVARSELRGKKPHPSFSTSYSKILSA